jgi:N-methylhydantoinase B
MPLRYRVASGFGVDGGGAGRTGGVWIWDRDAFDGLTAVTGEAYADARPVAGRLDPETNAPSGEGEYVWFGREPVWRTQPYALLRYLTNGGGGSGDPFERDPERVKLDVRDGYVTVEGAARDYGVVVLGDPDEDPEGLAVDLEATARLRGRP